LTFDLKVKEEEEVEEAEAEEKIRLKQYVSLRSKGRHNNDNALSPFLLIIQHKL
jgi:hypothetical protein